MTSESEIAKNFNFDNERFYVPERQRPHDDDINRFVELAKALPKDKWLYIHDLEGDGRATTFMVMHDMMKNADKVKLDDIIKRQAVIGGVDLLKIPSKENYYYEYSHERAAFVENFYKYAQDNIKLNFQ